MSIHWASMLANNPRTIMDRVRASANTYVLKAMLDSVVFQVFEYDTREELLLNTTGTNGTEIGSVAAITIATSVFDTLQTDSYWQDEDGNAIDLIGYNLRFTIPHARFPRAAKWYLVIITFTPIAGGEPFTIEWAINTTSVSQG